MQRSPQHRRRFFLAPLLLGAAVLTTGCPDREVGKVDPKPITDQKKEVPVQINRDIDILFVIDNSGSMREEQDSLAGNFNRFINVLNNIEGGLPNVHIGVVSTDVGAGPFGIDKCSGDGDSGNLQAQPQGACNAPDDQFIVDLAREDGSRDTNYTGDLADVFSCIAQLGTGGCGFEQPLESMYRALNGNATNNGFLREDAFLAVIIISDEDDCSTENTQMFNTDASLDRIDSDLGFLSSFRCFEFGVQCEPDDPRVPGVRQNCVPRESSTYMYNVNRYVDFLKGLKKDPSQVIVAGIIGNPEPVVVGTDEEQKTALVPSCTSGSGAADPAVRLAAFVNSFPQRSALTQICNEDLSDALTVIAELLRKVIGNPCVEGNIILDDSGQPEECRVSDVQNLGQENQVETLLDRCNGAMDNLPCYHFVKDAAQCAGDEFPTQLTLVIERGAAAPAINTTVVANCTATVESI